MLNDQLSTVLRRWASRVRVVGGHNPRYRLRPTLRLEEYEARVVPATLPAASVDDGSERRVINSTFPAPYTGGSGFDGPLGNQVITAGLSIVSTMANEYDPQVVASPTDPSRLVMFSTGSNVGGGDLNVFGRYSLNGGQDWVPFFDARDTTNTDFGTRILLGNRFDDLSLDPNPGQRSAFLNASQPSASFGRDGHVYLTMIQHNNAKTSGAVVLFRINFTGNVPIISPLGGFSQDNSAGSGSGGVVGASVTGKLIYRWTGQDPAYNPTVAVENGLASSTDPEDLQRIQASTTAFRNANPAVTSTMRDAVFVAWNTDATPTSVNNSRYANSGTLVRFTPNIILMAHSFDLGVTFAEPVPVQNDAYGVGAGGGTNPQLLFSPNSADRTAAPFTQAGAGRLVVGWTGNDGSVRTDTSRPDGGVQDAPIVAVGFKKSTVNAVPILDALPPPQGMTNPVPVSVEMPLLVETTDFSADFDVVTDLNVRISVIHHNVGALGVTLIPPQALLDAGYTPVRLVISGTAGNDFGYTVFPANPFRRREVGMWFDEQAPRRVDEAVNQTAIAGTGFYTNRYQSDLPGKSGVPAPRQQQFTTLAGNGTFLGAPFTISPLGLIQFEGLTPALMSGEWKLRVTDYVTGDAAPVNYGSVSIQNFALKATGRVRNGLDTTNVPFQNSVEQSSAYLTTATQPAFNRLQQNGPDQQAVATLAPNAATPNTQTSPVSAATGVGSGLRLAYDTTQGSFSPYRGRLYAIYTAVTPGNASNNNTANTDIYLQYSDDNGTTWSSQIRVNKDTLQDNTTGGSRAQFQPAITVDPLTGTVVVMWYDAAPDGSNGRVSTHIATSIDGGKTWSDAQFANAPKTAVDALTLERRTLESVPTNVQTLNNVGNGPGALGLGLSQSLLAHGGKIRPYFSGNLNTSGVKVYTADVRTAGGPRVVYSDMGPVTEAGRFLSGTVAGVPVFATIPGAGGVEYNNSFDGEGGQPDDPNVANGTRLLDGFVLRFDRSVEPMSLIGAVTVEYRSPTGIVSNVVVDSVLAIETLDFAADSVYFVRFAQKQHRTGAYSYALAPTVRDRVRNPYQLATFEQFGTNGANIPLVTPLPWPAGNGPNRFTRIANIGIPNATGAGDGVATSILTVNSGVNDVAFPLASLVVDLNIDHPNTQDLVIELVSPDGVRVKLIESRGGPGDNFVNTRLDSNAKVEIADAARAIAPFTGEFRPEKLPLPTSPFYPAPPIPGVAPNNTGRYSLDAFIGGRINGNWTLIVTDQGVGTQAPATLKNFSLTFTAGRRNSPTDQAPGNYLDQDADGRTLEGREITLAGGIEYPRPVSNDLYTVPGAANGRPNRIPLDSSTLPLTLAGPRIVSTSAEGQTPTVQRVVVNGTLTNSVKVTFSAMQGAQSLGNLRDYVQQGMVWITGPIAGQFGVVPVRATGIVADPNPPMGALPDRSFILTTANNLTPGETYSVVFGPGLVATFTSSVVGPTTLQVVSSEPMRALDLQAAIGAGFLRITRRAPDDTRTGLLGMEEGIPVFADRVVAADGSDGLTNTFLINTDQSPWQTGSGGQFRPFIFPDPDLESFNWGVSRLDPNGTYDVRVELNPRQITVQNEIVRNDRNGNPVIAVTLIAPATIDTPPTISNIGNRNPVSPRLIQDALNTGRITITDRVTGETFRPTRVEAVDDTNNTVVAPTVTALYWFGVADNRPLTSSYFVTIQPLPPFVNNSVASVNPTLRNAGGFLDTIDVIAPTPIDPDRLAMNAITVNGTNAFNLNPIRVVGVDGEGNPTVLPTRYIRLVVEPTGTGLVRNQNYAIDLGFTEVPTPDEVAVTAPNALNVTFDREIKPESVIRYAKHMMNDFLTVNGVEFAYDPNGVFGVDSLGNITTAPTRFLRITTITPPDPNATYCVYPGQFVKTDNVFLNAGASAMIVEFDRTMNAGTFTSADIIRLIGPTPDSSITNPALFTVTAVDAPRFDIPTGKVVYDTAAGNSRYFRVSFPALQLNGPYTLEIGSDIQSTFIDPMNPARVDRMDPNANAALDGLRGGADAGQPILNPVTGLAPGQAPNALAYSTVYSTITGRMAAPANPLRPARSGGDEISGRASGIPLSTTPGTPLNPAVDRVAIPSNGTGNLTVFIPDEFLIRQDLARSAGLRLTITPDIAFPNLPDLIGTLIAPDGTRVPLFTRLGTSGSGQVQFTPTFDDGASSPLGTIDGNVTGVFNPQLPLSRLLGKSSFGNWTLEVRNTGASTGFINGFTLKLTRALVNDGLGEANADRSQFGFRVFVQDPTNPTVTTQWTPVGPTPSTSVDNGAGGGVGAGAGAQQASNAGRVSSVAVDPSDASGNTVFAAGGSGGLWKTTNFLTQDPAGPLWVPLTDFGPTAALTISSITVIPRPSLTDPSQLDPTRSVVLALTGGGAQASSDVNSPARQGGRSGIGLLVSENGGQTFKIADSSRNASGPVANPNGLPNPADPNNWLGIDDRASGGAGDVNFRDGLFLGRNGAKITFDPKVNVSGGYFLYMAIADTAGRPGGIFRSSDTGRTWQLLQAGNATDVVLAAGSADSTGQLQTLYAAFGLGGGATSVFSTSVATSVVGGQLVPLSGGVGVQSIGDAQNDAAANPPTLAPVGVNGPSANGIGGNAPRGTYVRLATPALANSPLLNSFYRGWLYAVVTANDQFQGLWLTKDGGDNWTRITLPRLGQAGGLAPTGGYATNADPAGFGGELQGWVTDPNSINITVDPTNPNVVYLTGNYVVRVDATVANTPQTFVYFDNSTSGQGGTSQANTVGGVTTRAGTAEGSLRRQGSASVYTDADGTPTSFLNLQRDPDNPFVSNTTLQVNNAGAFTNNGFGATWTPYMTEALSGSVFVYGVTSLVDPLTGKARLIFGTQQGIFTGVDSGDGTVSRGIGFADSVRSARNGNLQIAQLYSGAVQPSQLAADVAGAMFYAVSDGNGFPVTGGSTLQTGNTTGATRDGDRIGADINPPQYASGLGVAGGFDARGTMAYGSGTGVATDPSGSGTAYQYRLPNEFDGGPGFTNRDFFRTFTPGNPASGTGTSRTSGLFSDGAGGSDLGQWNNQTVATGVFAANPFDPNALVIASGIGRLYLTKNRGLQWNIIGQPSVNFGGQNIRSLAFGAPDFVTQPDDFNNLVYVGTQNGNVFVTANGAAPYTLLFSGLAQFGDNSPVVRISANTKLGSKDIVIVTQRGVYFLAGANGAGQLSAASVETPRAAWGNAVNVTGNLFNIAEPVFGEDRSPLPGQFFALRANSLAALAVDWRYAINNGPTGQFDPTANSFPVVYVGGDGGVFRSADLFRGTASNWTAFPNNQPVLNPDGSANPIGDGATEAGGYLPNTVVTDLDLAVGDFRFNAATQTFDTDYANGYNMLLATTYGRGQWTIRLNPNFQQVFTDPGEFQPGPIVTSANNASEAEGINVIRLTFAGPVDPVTFTPADVRLFDPAGAAVTVSKVVLASPQTGVGTNPRNVYDIFFDGTPDAGAYRVVIGRTSVEGMDRIRVSFSNPDLTAADLSLFAPDGVGGFSAAPTPIARLVRVASPVGGPFLYDILLGGAPAAGNYRAVITATGIPGAGEASLGALSTNSASEITDFAGNRMNQNRDGRNGDANIDAFTALITFVPMPDPSESPGEASDTFLTLAFGEAKSGATFLPVGPNVGADAAGTPLVFGNTVLVAGTKALLTVTATKFATFAGPSGEGGPIGATIVDTEFGGFVDLADLKGAKGFYYSSTGERISLAATAPEVELIAGVGRVFVEFEVAGAEKVLEASLLPPSIGTPSVNFGRALFTVIAGLADHFDVTGADAVTPFPAVTKAGVAQDVTVTARDEFNNVADRYKGTVTFASDAPVVNGLATFSQPSYTFRGGDRPDIYSALDPATLDGGDVTLAGLVTLRRASQQRDTATADPLDLTPVRLFGVSVAGTDAVGFRTQSNLVIGGTTANSVLFTTAAPTTAAALQGAALIGGTRAGTVQATRVIGLDAQGNVTTGLTRQFRAVAPLSVGGVPTGLSAGGTYTVNALPAVYGNSVLLATTAAATTANELLAAATVTGPSLSGAVRPLSVVGFDAAGNEVGAATPAMSFRLTLPADAVVQLGAAYAVGAVGFTGNVVAGAQPNAELFVTLSAATTQAVLETNRAGGTLLVSGSGLAAPVAPTAVVGLDAAGNPTAAPTTRFRLTLPAAVAVPPNGTFSVATGRPVPDATVAGRYGQNTLLVNTGAATTAAALAAAAPRVSGTGIATPLTPTQIVGLDAAGAVTAAATTLFRVVLPGDNPSPLAPAGSYSLTSTLAAPDNSLAAAYGNSSLFTTTSVPVTAATLNGFRLAGSLTVTGPGVVAAVPMQVVGLDALGRPTDAATTRFRLVMASSVVFHTGGAYAVATPALATTGAAAGFDDTIEVQADVAASLKVSGLPPAVAAGETNTFYVNAYDQFGNDALGLFAGTAFTSKVTPTILPLPAPAVESPSAVVAPVSHQFTAADMGQFAFEATLYKADPLNGRTITATSDALPPLPVTPQTGIIVLANEATSIEITAVTTPVTAGEQGEFTITAYDEFGNVADGRLFTIRGEAKYKYTGTVNLSTDHPLGNASFLFNGGMAQTSSKTFTFVDGDPANGTAKVTFTFTQAKFRALPGDPANGWTITATDPNLSTIASPNTGFDNTDTVVVEVNPAAATRLELTQGFAPNPIDAGELGTFTLTALDAFDNVANGGTLPGNAYVGAVTLSSNTVGLGGTVTFGPLPTAFVAEDLGVKQFTASFSKVNPVVGGVAKLYDIVAVGAGLAGSATTGEVIAVRAAAAAFLKVEGYNAFQEAGVFGDFTVTIYDRFENIANNAARPYSGTVTVQGLPVDAGASFASTSFTFPGDGTASKVFSGKFTKAGENRAIQATGTNLTSPDADQSQISIFASALNKFAVANFPSPIVAGTPAVFTVTAQDEFGNTLDGQFDNKAPGTPGDTLYTGSVLLSSDDPQASFVPFNRVGTGFVNGVGTFQATLRTSGLKTITATDDRGTVSTADDKSGSQTGILVTAAALNKFVVTQFFASTGQTVPVVMAGADDPTDNATPGLEDAGYRFQVSGADIFGNAVTTYTGSVVFRSTDAQASLPGGYTFVSSDMGSKVFFATLRTAGQQSIVVQDGANGTLNGSQTGYRVVAAPASRFSVTGYPSGAAMTPQNFTVTARDAFGNVADGSDGEPIDDGIDQFGNDYTGTVTFTSNDPAATLPAPVTFTAADRGVRTLSATLNTAGVRTITATDDRGTPSVADDITGTQGGIVISSGIARMVVVGAFTPSPLVAGSQGQFEVRIVDEGGNNAVGYTGTVTFRVPAGVDATLPVNYTFTAGDAGRRVFNATLRTAGAPTITVSDVAVGTINGTSLPIPVVAAAAARFEVAGFPTSTAAGADSAFTVVARDAFGNVATGYAGTVAFRSSDPNAGLPGAFTFTAANAGVAVLSASLKTVGVQSITATDAVNGAIAGTQGNITVTPAGASRFALTGYPAATGAGVPQTFTVTATDAFGNLATGFVGTVTFRSSDPRATLPVDFTFTPADGGVRTFAATLRTAGAQSLTVTNIADPNGTATQDGITVLPGEAVGYTVTVAPSGTAGGPTLVTVTVRDAFGNVASGYLGTIAFGSSDRNAGLPPSHTFTAADAGVRVFAVTFQTAGPQTVTIVDVNNPALVATSSNPTSVGSSVAVRFAVGGFPNDAVAGAPGDLTVTAFDAFGNVATGYTGTVVFRSSDPRAVLPAPQTLVGGTGTFPALLLTAGSQTLTASDATNGAVTGSQTVSVRAGVASAPPIFTVSTGPGASNVVQVRDADGRVIASFQPFEASFTGGTTSAIAATPFGNKLVVAAGPGRQPDVRVFDLATGSSTSMLPFETTFTGGVNLSVGDVNGDGFDDYVLSPDQGGGPRIQIRDGRTGEKLADFFAFTDDTNFRGGARTALGDINGDGVLDLIVAAGFGGGPRVAIFDGKSLLSGAPTRLVSDFFAFEPGLRNGVYVAAGDVNGDGKADLILGAGPGGGPRVRIVDGAGLLAANVGNLDLAPALTIGNFFAGDQSNRGGVRVTTTNLDNDNRSDLVVGAGEGSGSRVTGYTANVLLSETPFPDFDLDAFPGFEGGVYVG